MGTRNGILFHYSTIFKNGNLMSLTHSLYNGNVTIPQPTTLSTWNFCLRKTYRMLAYIPTTSHYIDGART